VRHLEHPLDPCDEGGLRAPESSRPDPSSGRVRRISLRRATARAAAGAPSASTATPGCRIVKYFDADGEVRFKKERP
jgi:hypothetical protein